MSGGYKGRRGRRSVTYPPANMQTTPTLLLLLAGLAVAFPGNTSHYSTNSNNCVEIINYGEVEYTASQVVACGYETRRQCRPRSKEVCEEVVVEQVCQLKGNIDCEERTLTVARQEARPARQVFTPQQCRRGEDVQLVETKQRVECHTVTRPQCDSRWEVDPATGEKVWVGNQNCRDVSWEECELVPTQVTQQVEQYDCQAGPSITYDGVEQNSVDYSTYYHLCEPIAAPVCSERTERQCVTVEWEDCQDELVPSCENIVVNKPSQEATHLLRCAHH